jgi:hypothetical protein
MLGFSGVQKNALEECVACLEYKHAFADTQSIP